MEKSENSVAAGVATRPVVAIVGRQNVGKSTLLNRMVQKRLAITSGIPGTTRDRIMVEVSQGGRNILVVDTGGISPETGVRNRPGGDVPGR